LAGGDPAGIVMEWVAAFQREPYDLAGGLPFRVRVGMAGMEPRMVIFGMPHVAADFLSSRVLFDDLVRDLAGRTPAGQPGLQPAEMARQERSDEGRRTLRRSLGYWRRVVAGGPAASFATAGHPPESPRYRTGVITSHAVPRALDRLAGRYGAGTSHVLLAAVATLIGRHTGHDRCLVRTVVGNRGRPELRNAVGTFSQEVAVALDLTPDRFDEMVRTARVASLHGMRHGRYDPDAVAGVVAEAGVTLDVYFNDMWTATRSDRGSRGYEGAVKGTAETTFEWGERLDRANVAFFFETQEVFDDPEAACLSLLTDTARVPAPAIRLFLFALEKLLTTLADDDGVKLDEIDLTPA
jgi:hypothetical protein